MRTLFEALQWGHVERGASRRRLERRHEGAVRPRGGDQPHAEGRRRQHEGNTWNYPAEWEILALGVVGI